MTEKEAKELTLEIWKYLYKHPKIYDKEDLPEVLYDKIKDFKDDCPLCTFFDDLGTRGERGDPDCPGCPLDISNCFKSDSCFDVWYTTADTRIRAKAAKSIFKAVKKWQIKEE